MNRVSSMISTLLCEAATAPACERKVVSILATAVGQGHIDLDLVCKVEHWDCKSGSFVNLSNLHCAFYDLHDALCEALKLLSSFQSSSPSPSPSPLLPSPPQALSRLATFLGYPSRRRFLEDMMVSLLKSWLKDGFAVTELPHQLWDFGSRDAFFR